MSDHHEAGPELAHQLVPYKFCGGGAGVGGVVMLKVERIHTQRFNAVNAILQAHNEADMCLGAVDGGRMGIKRENNNGPTEFPANINGAGEHGTVPTVDAVVHPEGHDAPVKIRRNI